MATVLVELYIRFKIGSDSSMGNGNSVRECST